MRRIVGQKVRVDRGEKDDVERTVGKGEAVGGRRGPLARVIRTIGHLGMMKPEGRMPRRNRPDAPRNCLPVGVDAVVSTLEVTDQAHSEIADPGTDIQDTMLAAESRNLEFRACR